MYTYSGRYVTCHIPDDVYVWPANKEEIQAKVRELNAMIESMLTGETQPWPGAEKIGDLFIL